MRAIDAAAGLQAMYMLAVGLLISLSVLCGASTRLPLDVPLSRERE